MRYLGGKRRLAKHIRDIILGDVGTGNGHYWEPFVGGGAVGAVLGPHFDHAHYSDSHPDLILMWQALAAGWEPPSVVTPERYQELRNAEPSAERGFVGFGGSFGGRFFAGYAKGGYQASGEPRNHQAESARAVTRDAKAMMAKLSTDFRCIDYASIEPEPGSVIYCDPPYAETTSYRNDEPFDTDRFWGVVEGWERAGCHVFVSSYEAPSGWATVMERRHRSSVKRGDEERHVATERLYRLDTGGPIPYRFEQMGL